MKKNRFFNLAHTNNLLCKSLALIVFASMLSTQPTLAEAGRHDNLQPHHHKKSSKTKTINHALETLSRRLAELMQDQKFRRYCREIASKTHAVVTLSELIQPRFAADAGVNTILRHLSAEIRHLDKEHISKIKISIPIETWSDTESEPWVAYVPLGVFGYLTNSVKAFDSRNRSFYLSEDTSSQAPVILLGYFDTGLKETQTADMPEKSYSREECVGCWFNGTSCRVFVQRCHYCCINCEFSERCGACFGWWNKVGPCYPQ